MLWLLLDGLVLTGWPGSDWMVWFLLDGLVPTGWSGSYWISLVPTRLPALAVLQSDVAGHGWYGWHGWFLTGLALLGWGFQWFSMVDKARSLVAWSLF
jgi:hypothetical protein